MQIDCVVSVFASNSPETFSSPPQYCELLIIVVEKMAEQALKKLEQQLNCSICLDTYSKPKELQCHHVYCEKCLEKLLLVDQDQQKQLSLTCPNCRQVTPVPASGVAGLQTAFHINYLLEIRSSLKKIDETAITLEGPGAVGGAIRPSSATLKVSPHCSVHTNKELDLYCDTCEDLICLKCALKGGSHHSHDCIEAKEAFEKYKEEILSSLEPMKKHLTTIHKALTQLEARCGEISDQEAAIEGTIHHAFRNLQEALDVRKTKLIRQLHGITQGKLKGLAVQRDQMETTQAQLGSYLLFMGEKVKTGHQREVLRVKNTTLRQVKELTTTFRMDNLELNTHADMMFSALEDAVAVCQKFGDIVMPDTLEVDPSRCYATGMGLEVAVLGEESSTFLQVVDFRGHACEIQINSYSNCELVSEITGSRICGTLKRKRDKNRCNTRYRISYRPTIKGRHQLHITVKGQHIKGSPFCVSVKSPVKKFDTPILTINGVDQPESVAINRRGEMVVTESGRSCVTVFSPSGERLRVFGSCGSGQGQFKKPRGIALDDKGNIFVTDSGNNRIQKLTAEGQFLAAVGTEGSGPLRFRDLHGIAFNTTNSKLYVVDRYPNHCVQVLNPNFTFHKLYGKKGVDVRHFDYPWGITCDSTGKVYVADTSNRRIQVFTAEMDFLYLIGGHAQFIGIGKSYSKLGLPVSVAVDNEGVVYVGDHGLKSTVSVFTSQGDLLAAFNCSSWTDGLAVDDNGVLYVTLRNNCCIDLF